MAEQRLIVVNGVRYHADRPGLCALCVLEKSEDRLHLGRSELLLSGRGHCDRAGKRSEGCCYAKGSPCVSACCYKDLDQWLNDRRKAKGGSHG